MSLPRFFSKPVALEFDTGQSVTLEFEPSDYHHIVHVMRVCVGEETEVVVRDTWRAYRMKVIGFCEPSIVFEVLEVLEMAQPSHKIALFFGLSKGDKNDTIVRQAVEIGAHALYPVLFSRSVVKLDEKKIVARSERLRKIAQSAAQQSHRQTIPQVCDIASLGDVTTLQYLDSYDHVYVLWEETQGITLTKLINESLATAREDESFACVVGPEGGITREEIELLVEHGALCASLGSSILRVDTANAVTLGVLCALLGEASS